MPKSVRYEFPQSPRPHPISSITMKEIEVADIRLALRWTEEFESEPQRRQLRVFNELVRASIVLVDDAPVEQPYLAFESLPLRTIQLIRAAFTKLHPKLEEQVRVAIEQVYPGAPWIKRERGTRAMSRFVQELVREVPELAPHVESIERVVAEVIEKKGYKCACRYDAGVSMTQTEQSEKEDAVRMVYVAPRNGWGGLSVFYDLLHEAGHVESGQSAIAPGDWSPEITKERERRELEAWEFARMFLQAFAPDLWQNDRDRFEARRKFCLRTYGIEVPPYKV